jgi:hypothetical protein
VVVVVVVVVVVFVVFVVVLGQTGLGEDTEEHAPIILSRVGQEHYQPWR